MTRLGLLTLAAALSSGAAPTVVKGERLVFHFVASPIANLTFGLDAMAELSAADPSAYRALWRRELRWDREDDLQLARWKDLRSQQFGGRLRGSAAPPQVAWPPNYAGYYGQEFGLDQDVRIAGFQASNAKNYRKRLGRVVEDRIADGLTAIIRHFLPRFDEFWLREGRRLTAPKAEGFALLCRQRGILALAEQFAAFTEAELPRRHDVWFYLIAHPSRFGKSTMATQMQSHAPVELLDEEQPEDKLGVVIHELVHHFYDRAPRSRHLSLIEEFRALAPPWRMAAYSYLNEAVATAAGILVERRLRTNESFVQWIANPANIYSQPWIAALGNASYSLIERCLDGSCGLFNGYASRYLAAAETALGPRLQHPHFRLASRILIFSDARLRSASQLFRSRVPSITHANGFENLTRFPDLPVVVLALDTEAAALRDRVGPGREVTVLSGPTAEAVEREVERFAMRPF